MERRKGDGDVKDQNGTTLVLPGNDFGDRITESYFNYSQDEMDPVCCKGGGEHELVHKQGLSLRLSPDISSNFSWKVYCHKR